MTGVSFALLAALLFGASTPFAKLLIGETDPWVLAGLLYFGSGIGLLLILGLRYLKTKEFPKIPNKKDLIWLLGATLFGGVIGPVLLMSGLSTSPAATSSLLLNVEGVLTSTLAWFVFKEHYDKRIVIGMIAIVLGGVILSWSGEGTFNLTPGSLLIMGACLCWAVDNNLTRNVSTNDAVLITTIKSLVAGTTNLILAILLRKSFPDTQHIAMAALLGFFGYGLSIVYFVLSLRAIGTSRTGAYFSAAPFAGAVLSLFIFKGELSVQLVVASLFMGFGVWLHLTEKHDHEHTHEEMYHSHEHTHDEHHQHEHQPSDPAGQKHTHYHRHTPMTHKHPHFPDVHHRHEHHNQ